MARFFFDVTDGNVFEDDEGIEFLGAKKACDEALRSLPDMAKGHHLTDGVRDVTIVVRGEHGRPIYQATLTINGQWLDAPMPLLHIKQ